MFTPESRVLRECRLAASKCGARVFRNSTGYDPVSRVRYGLCVGSADLIGWTRDGRFLAIECKAPRGRSTAAQRRFLAAVNRAGGVGIIAKSAADVVEKLGGETR